jgi:hypothetical protein
MPSSALIDRLHAEIVVTCEYGGCGVVFTATEQTSEPVELWSVRAATEAEIQGWAVAPPGRLLCPVHGRLAVSPTPTARPLQQL